MKKLYCGVDLGTSSVKTVAYDKSFYPIFKFVKEYQLQNIEENHAELNPDEVLSKTVETLKDLVIRANQESYQIQFISFSSALHSLIAVGRDYKPLTGCLTWADSRAMEFKSELENFYYKEGIYQKTGCPPHAMYMPAKILWIKKYRPELARKTAKYITIKEYILYKLTSQKMVDYSLAGAGGLMNINKLRWENKVLDFLEISSDHLGQLVDAKKQVNFNEYALDCIGADIPVIIGSGDGPLANLGSGSFQRNDYVITIGTSGAVRKFSNSPVFDKNQRTWCYMLDEDIYLPGGAINNGGLVLNWIKNNFYQELNSEDEFFIRLENALIDSPPGSNRLFFLPFLTGERSPNWESITRGIILGLGLNHGRQEIVKAAVEGIVMRIYAVYQALDEMLGEDGKIIATGGFTRSEAWLQILADILGKKVYSFQNHEASAAGAAMLGAVAVGEISDYGSIEVNFEIKSVKEPDYHNHIKYQKLFALHQKIYQKNRDIFTELQALN